MLTKHQTNIALAIFAIFLFLSFTIPIHIHPYRTYYHEVLGVLAVLMSMSYWAAAPRLVVRIPHAVLLPLGLIIVIVVQLLAGLILYPIDMFFPIVILACFAIAMIYGATLAMQENGLRKLMLTCANTFLVIGLVSVFIQFVQILKLNWMPFVVPLSWSDSPRPYGNLAQPNMLALLFCFSVASVWYLYAERQIRTWIGFFSIVFLLLGLALTQSRIAWIILPCYVLISCKPAINAPRISKWLLASLLAVFILFVFVVPHVLNWFGIAANSVQERAGQTAARLVMWDQAWSMSLAHPWFGVGWYQFGTTQALISSLFKPTEYSNYAHNIVLNFGAEIGWPATIVVFGSASYWFYRCCLRRWNNPSIRLISLMILAITVHSMVEFPLWYGFVLMPFGVIIGAAHVDKLKWEHITVARGCFIAFMVTCMVSTGAMTWDYDRVAKGFVALAWQQEGKKNGVGSTEKPEFTFYSQFYDYFHIIKIDLGPNMAQSDLDFLERVTLRFTFQPLLSRLAIAYANNDRPDNALKTILIINRLHNELYPQTYSEWANLAQTNPHTCGAIFTRMPQPRALDSISPITLKSMTKSEPTSP